MPETPAPIRCVGAVVHDERGRLLLVRRAREPHRGLWSLPGGRAEPGEPDRRAVRREVAEETGLRVRVAERVGRVDLPGPGGVTFRVHDYRCRPLGTALHPGDDAAQARWATAAELAELALVPDLIDTLRRWGCLPR